MTNDEVCEIRHSVLNQLEMEILGRSG